MIRRKGLVKSKARIKEHGEVFTPIDIIRKMIAVPELETSLMDLNTKVLEPSVGEGDFLMEILKRRLDRIAESPMNNIKNYENYSLLALSTLYGIELLHDNASICVMNIYQTFYEHYRNIANKYESTMDKNVLASARTIISANIVQGNFLTKLRSDGSPIIFSDWKVNRQSSTRIIVERIEYDFEVMSKASSNGDSAEAINSQFDQLDLFGLMPVKDKEETEEIVYRYKPVLITKVFKEEMEEVSG